LFIYTLEVDECNHKAFIKRESLSFQQNTSSKNEKIFEVINGELTIYNVKNFRLLPIQILTGSGIDVDTTVIKAFGSFRIFPGVKTLLEFFEESFISDIHVNKTKSTQVNGFAEHLSEEGENLSFVLQFYYENHREVFDQILESLSERVPGISEIGAKTTEEGSILLNFKDKVFEDPFPLKNMTDGTIKMLAYLVLLYDPNPHPLICIENPEKHIYPSLLYEVAEDFRSCTVKGSQVFIFTHSPEFLNAATVDEVFWLEKKRGYTNIVCANQNKQIVDYMNEGDQMGYLWRQGFFGGE
jgi:predicted ATPase